MRLSTLTLIALTGFFVIGLQLATGEQHNDTTPPTAPGNGLYEAQGNLIIRDSPPGWFALKGNQIGTLSSGQQVVIEERRNVKDLFGEQEWLKIRDPERGVTGWVYNGKTRNGIPYIFQPSRPEPS